MSVARVRESPLPTKRRLAIGTSSVHPSAADPRRPDVAQAMDMLRAIVRALRLETRAIEQQLGISLAQLWVLQILNERAAQSLNELAIATATHQSSVSVVVKRLVERQLVERSTQRNDRRRLRLELTDAGRAILRTAPVTVQMKLVQGLRRLAPDRGAQLAALLRDWLTAAGLDTGVVPPMLMEDE